MARVVDEFGPPQLELILRAALPAPDHGGFRPWRIIEFRSEARGALAAIFPRGCLVVLDTGNPNVANGHVFQELGG